MDKETTYPTKNPSDTEEKMNTTEQNLAIPQLQQYWSHPIKISWHANNIKMLQPPKSWSLTSITKEQQTKEYPATNCNQN